MPDTRNESPRSAPREEAAIARSTVAAPVAALVVDFLAARGVDRVFGLQGGHIQPIWDVLGQRGIRIVDVRDEGAAVHMAHAHAVLTGRVGVAMVTAGPGVTNCVTAMANAQLERVPVLLIGGCAPVAQDDLGPLQGIAHVDIMRPVVALVEDDPLRRQRAARSRQGVGHRGGRRQSARSGVCRDSHRRAAHRRRAEGGAAASISRRDAPRRIPPDAADVKRAARVIGEARRPLVLTGRGALGAGDALAALSGPDAARSTSTRRRAGASSAPIILGGRRHTRPRDAGGRPRVIVGRKLDYQTGYGSPAVPQRAPVRIADNWEELRENRRGEVELFADPGLALAALADTIAAKSATLDTAWTAALRAEHLRRAANATPTRSPPRPPATTDTCIRTASSPR